RRGRQVAPLRVRGRLMTADSATPIAACEAGAGIAQILEIGCAHLLRSGRLVALLPEWSDERFPLYATTPSRLHRAAKARAFVAFVEEILATA
ncbi:MAG TPA: LysR substrate-binding domain-containing protein, partial [Rhodanobacteraceae bacterium]|nr:LysR substrate-binding domain-containing protein [Rhodanobacteraceae bacterium]